MDSVTVSFLNWSLIGLQYRIDDGLGFFRTSLESLAVTRRSGTYDVTNRLISSSLQLVNFCLYSLCPVLPSKPHLPISLKLFSVLPRQFSIHSFWSSKILEAVLSSRLWRSTSAYVSSMSMYVYVVRIPQCFKFQNFLVARKQIIGSFAINELTDQQILVFC